MCLFCSKCQTISDKNANKLCIAFLCINRSFPVRMGKNRIWEAGSAVQRKDLRKPVLTTGSHGRLALKNSGTVKRCLKQ